VSGGPAAGTRRSASSKPIEPATATGSRGTPLPRWTHRRVVGVREFPATTVSQPLSCRSATAPASAPVTRCR